MDQYPLTINEITIWFCSKEPQLSADGLVLAAIRENSSSDKPSACADFDTPVAMGRIVVWVSGEIDFEILRVSDGNTVLFHHQDVLTLDSVPLQVAFDRFIQCMNHPN
jgi:hypothetical protein